MTARESAATERAVAEAIAHPDRRLVPIAEAHGIAPSTLRRAMRRAGQPPRLVPTGEAAAGYVDGRWLKRPLAPVSTP